MISAKLTFYGLCRDALMFYKDIFQGEIVSLKTFEEEKEQFPQGVDSSCSQYIYSAEIKITHGDDTSYISMGDSPIITFTGLDGSLACRDNVAFDVKLAEEEESVRIFNGFLNDGAKTNVPLKKTDTYSLFGSLIDRYGVCWSLFSTGQG